MTSLSWQQLYKGLLDTLTSLILIQMPTTRKRQYTTGPQPDSTTDQKVGRKRQKPLRSDSPQQKNVSDRQPNPLKKRRKGQQSKVKGSKGKSPSGEDKLREGTSQNKVPTDDFHKRHGRLEFYVEYLSTDVIYRHSGKGTVSMTTISLLGFRLPFL
jgi:hypothetical protein